MAVLIYLPKLKKYLGLAFGAHFQHDFFIKMFCIYSINRVFTLSMDSFNTVPFFFPNIYQAKCVIKFLFRQLTVS